MEKFSWFAQTLQDLCGSQANRLAFTTSFRKRASKLNGSAFVLAVVGGWLTNPQASRAELAQWVGVSKQALAQSLNEKAAAFLKALLEWALSQLVQTEPTVRPLLERFKAVYVLDSTVLSLPVSLKVKLHHFYGVYKAKLGQVYLS